MKPWLKHLIGYSALSLIIVALIAYMVMTRTNVLDTTEIANIKADNERLQLKMDSLNAEYVSRETNIAVLKADIAVISAQRDSIAKLKTQTTIKYEKDITNIRRMPADELGRYLTERLGTAKR